MAVQTTSSDDMEALVPTPGGDMCTKFQNGLKVNRVWYDWLAFMYTEGGEFTEDFKKMLKSARS